MLAHLARHGCSLPPPQSITPREAPCVTTQITRNSTQRWRASHIHKPVPSPAVRWQTKRENQSPKNQSRVNHRTRHSGQHQVHHDGPAQHPTWLGVKVHWAHGGSHHTPAAAVREDAPLRVVRCPDAHSIARRQADVQQACCEHVGTVIQLIVRPSNVLVWYNQGVIGAVQRNDGLQVPATKQRERRSHSYCSRRGRSIYGD